MCWGIFMVVKFLKKIRSELLKEKLELKSEQNKIRIKSEENIRFIHKLREEENLISDVMSPRRHDVNYLNHNIQNLEEESKSLSDLSLKIEKQIDHIDQRLLEFDQVIKNARERKSADLMLSEKDENFAKNIKTEEKNIRVMPDLSGIVNKIDLCLKILDVDKNRCKLELISIRKALQEISKI